MATPPISELFSTIAEWAISRGADKLNELPGCWEEDWLFDGRKAVVSINGRPKPTKNSVGLELGPYQACIAVNDMPMALCDPVGGVLVGAFVGMEDDLIHALRADTIGPAGG